MVREVLEDPRYAERAREVAAVIAEEHRLDVPADEVEALALRAERVPR